MENNSDNIRIEITDKINLLISSNEKLHFAILELFVEFFSKANNTVEDQTRIVFEFDKYRMFSEIAIDYVEQNREKIVELKSIFEE